MFDIVDARCNHEVHGLRMYKNMATGKICRSKEEEEPRKICRFKEEEEQGCGERCVS